MIVRILTEGQFSLPGAHLDELNDIDNRLVEVVERKDRAEFNRLLEELLNVVRNNGTPVPLDEIVESDLVLPEPDITLEEAALEVGKGGLLAPLVRLHVLDAPTSKSAEVVRDASQRSKRAPARLIRH